MIIKVVMNTRGSRDKGKLEVDKEGFKLCKYSIFIYKFLKKIKNQKILFESCSDFI